ncbi:zinc-dependent dehydrogenase [Gracilibacillus sp. YIM 98692]|uniref:zinc-dependent dehydrogenase n=1 Tax=Gracilibacillus sp. YIM 98692 TaxID=2663532 RepID=UPI0013D1489A|nr:zinc-dependent dehydrogenase [Gracilibacillus sp. YIM 98692]
MKAAVLEDLRQMKVQNVPTPDIDDDSILMKVKAVGICGSDLRIYNSGNNRVTFPQIIGHEAAGIIERVGKNVTKFNVGDRICLGADVPCGECEFCEKGIGNNCQINYAMGYQFPGSFAEYVALNRKVVNYGPIHRIPDHISYEEAALAEPLACVINALEMCNIQLGDTVVVIGAGPIGCMLVEIAKHMGANKVILVQRSKERLKQAKQFGADVHVCTLEEDSIMRVKEETKGLGADVVLTANSTPDAQKMALQMAKNRGRVNFFGGLAKNDSNVTLDTNLIHYKELYVLGSHGSVPEQHKRAVDLISNGIINMKRYISDQFKLIEIERAFNKAAERKGMRIMIRNDNE